MPACPFNVTPAPLAGSYLYFSLQGIMPLFDSFYYSSGPDVEGSVFSGKLASGRGDRDFYLFAEETRGCASPALSAGPSLVLCLTQPLPPIPGCL